MPLDIKESRRSRILASDTTAVVWSQASLYRYEHLSEDDKDLVRQLLKGQITLDQVPTIKSNSVKIFISSTFSDMVEERNALAENVYPKLREYCRETHGLDFQAVDMRWGVPLDAVEYHTATELCLAELRSCQSQSIGPNFAAFLGQRYGCVPLPSSILRAEFELLESHMVEDDQSLMNICYLKDQNVHSNLYRLQTISHITENVKRTWYDIEQDLKRIIIQSSSSAVEAKELSRESFRKLNASVTEHEMYEGLIDVKRQKDRENNILLYVRDIQDLHCHYQDAKARKFVDLTEDCQINPEIKKSLDGMRENSIQKLPGYNCLKSSITWCENGMTSTSHKPYLNRMCSHFFKTTCALVDRNIASQKKLDSDPLYQEVVEHWVILKGRCETFVGRDDVFNHIKDYLSSKDSRHPLVIHGNSGSGKTSILAKTALLVESSMPSTSKPQLVFRFLGTTPKSSSIQPLLYSVCHQIAFISDKDRAQVPEDIAELKKYFTEVVKSGDFPGTIVIILDSLDQLSPNFSGLKLDWLPSRHAPNVRIIVSSLPDKHNVLDILRNKLSGNFVEVKPLPSKDCEQIIRTLMERSNRKVTYEQWKLIMKAFESCTLPLFVTLTYQQVTDWCSYDNIPPGTLMTTIEASIVKLFERMEQKHGKVFVSKAFGYITAARNGLSEMELEDILSLDDEVLNSVFVLWVPPIRRLPPSLWSRLRLDMCPFLVERESDGISVLSWYHQQFVNVVTERYLDYMDAIKIHHIIEEYYMGTWESLPKSFQYSPLLMERLNIDDPQGKEFRHVPKQPLILNKDGKGSPRYNRRKMNQLPFSLYHGRQLVRLKVICFCNYEWIYTKLKATSLQDVLADYAIFDDRETNLVADALRMTGSVLTKDPNVLGPELTGRLLPHVQNFDHIRELVRQADLHAQLHCPLVPNCQIYSAPGGPLQYECEVNIKTESPIDVDLFQCPDGILMTAKAYYNQTVQVWGLTQGEPRQDFKMPIGHIYPNGDGRFLCMFKNNRFVLVYKSDSGELHGEADFDYGKPRSIQTTKNLMIFITENGVGPYVIDIQKCVLLHKFTHNVKACAMSPDESFLVISTENGLMLFEVPLMEKRCSLTTRDAAKQIMFTSEHFKCFVLTQDNLFKSVKFNLKSKGAQMNEIISDYDIKEFKISHLEKYLLVRSARCLYLIDSKTESLKHRLQRMPDGVFVETMSTFTSAGFSPNDDMVLASRYTYIAVWDTVTGSPLRLLPASVSPILKIFTSDVLNKAVSLLKNNTLQVWNLDNLNADVQHANEVVKGRVKSLAVASTSKQIICTGFKQPEVTIVSLESGTATHTLVYSEDREDVIDQLELSPFGRYCVAKGKKATYPDINIKWPQLSYDIIFDLRFKIFFQESQNNRFTIFDKDCHFLACVQCHFYSKKDYIRNVYKVRLFRLNFMSKQNKTFDIPVNTEFVSKPVIYRSKDLLAFVSIFQTCTIIKDNITNVEVGRSFFCRLSLLNLEETGPREKTVTVGSILKHADENDRFLDVKVHDSNLVLIYTKDVEFYEFDAEKGLVCPPGVRKGAILYNPNNDFMLRHIPFILNPGTDVTSCKFSRRGTIILSDEMKVFEKRTNGYITTIETEVVRETARLALDGQYIIALDSCGKKLLVIRSSTDQIVSQLFIHGVASCVDVAEDDRTVVVGCNDGRVMILTLIIDYSRPMDEIAKLASRKDLPPQKEENLLNKDLHKITAHSSKDLIKTNLKGRGAQRFRSMFNAVKVTNKGMKARSQACSIQ